MKHIVFGLLLLVSVSAVSAPLEGRKPNIILILTDDQGYGQLACQGHPFLHTPHLDALHAESLSFSAFHVSPTCSPTRAALLTGNVPFKNGVTHTGGARCRLALSAITLPQLLQQQGYETGIFGKWHLGHSTAEYLPGARGFDEVFIHGYGGIGQPKDVPGNRYTDPVLFHNGRFVKTEGFCTDVFFDQAIAWMKRERTQPFFAYLSTNAPHGPFVAPQKNLERFQRMQMRGGPPGFYGMIENIDENIGKLLHAVRESGQEDNTLVIFMSDNGFPRGGTGTGKIGEQDGKPVHAYTAGLKGSKKTVHEGGTRVPAFFKWKGVLPEGQSCEALAAHIDLLPTLVGLAGGTVPDKLDGRSLLPLLEDAEAAWADRNLFFHIGRWSDKTGPDGSKYDTKNGFGVRNSRYRLVNNEELYDILQDPGETRNLYEQNPEIVQAMEAAYDDWWDEVRPFMVNENAAMPSEYVYLRLYREQLAAGDLPLWQPR